MHIKKFVVLDVLFSATLVLDVLPNSLCLRRRRGGGCSGIEGRSEADLRGPNLCGPQPMGLFRSFLPDVQGFGPKRDLPISFFFYQKKSFFYLMNYRLSLYFHLKLKNRIFCLLELAKPDISPHWVFFLSGFPIYFYVYLG